MRVVYYEFNPIEYIKSTDWVKKGMPQLDIDQELTKIRDQKQSSNIGQIGDRPSWKNSKALEEKIQAMSKFNKIVQMSDMDVVFNVIWDPIIKQLILLNISGELDYKSTKQSNSTVNIMIPSFIDAVQTIDSLVQTTRAESMAIESVKPLQITGLYDRLSKEEDALKRQFTSRGQYVGTLDLQNLELRNFKVDSYDERLLSQIDEISKHHKELEISEITQDILSDYYDLSGVDIQYVHPVFDNSTWQPGCFGDKLIIQEDTTKGLASVVRLFKNIDYQEIDCTDMTLKHLDSLDYLFSGCEKVKTIKINNLYTENKKSMAWMFSGCKSLGTVENLDKFNFQNVETTEGMFSYCQSIKDMDVSFTDMRNNKNLSSMFQMCKNMEKLDMSNIQIAENANMECMLFNCQKLRELSLDHIKQEVVIKEPLMYTMLWGAAYPSRIDVTGSSAQIQALALKTLQTLKLDKKVMDKILIK